MPEMLPHDERDIHLEQMLRERLGDLPLTIEHAEPLEIDWQRVISEAHEICRQDQCGTTEALTEALAREKALVRKANAFRGAR